MDSKKEFISFRPEINVLAKFPENFKAKELAKLSPEQYAKLLKIQFSPNLHMIIFRIFKHSEVRLKQITIEIYFICSCKS